jgi:Protein related to penicillin acylase
LATSEFPAKWKRQGDFVMPGTDSSYMWQGYIPMEENPHVINPERGFVSSANQLPLIQRILITSAGIMTVSWLSYQSLSAKHE